MEIAGRNTSQRTETEVARGVRLRKNGQDPLPSEPLNGKPLAPSANGFSGRRVMLASAAKELAETCRNARLAVQDLEEKRVALRDEFNRALSLTQESRSIVTGFRPAATFKRCSTRAGFVHRLRELSELGTVRGSRLKELSRENQGKAYQQAMRLCADVTSEYHQLWREYKAHRAACGC